MYPTKLLDRYSFSNALACLNTLYFLGLAKYLEW